MLYSMFMPSNQKIYINETCYSYWAYAPQPIKTYLHCIEQPNDPSDKPLVKQYYMGTFSNEYYGGGTPNIIRAVNPAFFIVAESSCANAPVAFQAKVPTGIRAYLWHFGDGQTSTEAAPTHTYAAAGTYTVSLTVTKTDGSVENLSKQITVYPKPEKLIIFGE